MTGFGRTRQRLFPVPGGGLTPQSLLPWFHNGTLKLFVRGLCNGIGRRRQRLVSSSGWRLDARRTIALVDRGFSVIVTGGSAHLGERLQRWAGLLL